jgi:hypothetical protein
MNRRFLFFFDCNASNAKTKAAMNRRTPKAKHVLEANRRTLSDSLPPFCLEHDQCKIKSGDESPHSKVEGNFDKLSEQEVRDLVAYLRGKQQVPLPK